MTVRESMPTLVSLRGRGAGMLSFGLVSGMDQMLGTERALKLGHLRADQLPKLA
jgi:hypothetical protein